jgi:YggT family protein
MVFIFNAIYFLIQLYMIILLFRVLLSWVSVNHDSALVRILYNLTEPVLAPIRRLLPSTGGFDYSPLVVIIILVALRQVVTILAGYLRV